MTEEIRNSIELIRARVLSLHQELVLERERVVLVQDELNRMTSVVEARDEEIRELRAECSGLTEQLNEARKEQVVTVDVSSTDRAIDSLVKEIDFCIQQLKVSHE